MNIPINITDTGWREEQAGYKERIVGPFRFSWSEDEKDISVAVFDRKTSEFHPFIMNIVLTDRIEDMEDHAIPCKDFEDAKKVTKKIIETIYPGVFLCIDAGIRNKIKGE